MFLCVPLGRDPDSGLGGGVGNYVGVGQGPFPEAEQLQVFLPVFDRDLEGAFAETGSGLVDQWKDRSGPHLAAIRIYIPQSHGDGSGIGGGVGRQVEIDGGGKIEISVEQEGGSLPFDAIDLVISGGEINGEPVQRFIALPDVYAGIGEIYVVFLVRGQVPQLQLVDPGLREY